VGRAGKTDCTLADTARLRLWCFSKVVTAEDYRLYKEIINWLSDRNIPHTFEWMDTGKYIPDYIHLDNESAIVFRLVFNI